MTYSDDVINFVLFALREGITIQNLMNRYHVSKRTIYRWCNLYMSEVKQNKRIQPKHQRSNRKIDIYAKAVVDYVTTNKGCSIYDIYNNAVNKEISLSTISRIAKANNIVHKKINLKTVAKDVTLINEDRKKFAQDMDYDMNSVIFTDEVSMRASAVLMIINDMAMVLKEMKLKCIGNISIQEKG